MRALKLDFMHPVPRPHWSAWLLLAAGLGMAALVGWQGEVAKHALDGAMAAAPKQVVVSARRSSPIATGEAGGTKDQLAAPWGNLFVRLEKSRPKHIALLALEADARKTEATLTAEARNIQDILAYVELLKSEAGFSSVTLASHALQEADPQLPLRFVLRLEWRT